MWKPKYLTIENFQSFESLSYIFQAGSAFSIEGENLTDDGQKSNGSGKSTIGEAIYYLLLGTSSTGKRDMKLVRWGCDHAFLHLDLENEKGDVFSIERRVFAAKSKSSEIGLMMNSVSLKDRYATVNDGNRLILEIIGISADDLRSYFLISRDRFVSFFSSPDSQKRALLSRFTSTDRVLKISENIDKDIEENSRKISEIDREISIQQASLSIYQSDLERLSPENLKKQKDDDIAFARANINAQQDSIDSENIKIRRSNENIANYRDNLAKIEKGSEIVSNAQKRLEKLDYDALIEDISDKIQKGLDKAESKKRQASEISSQINELKELIQPINLFIAGGVTCPKCGTEFNPKSDMDMTMNEAKSLKEDTSTEIRGMISSLEEIRKSVAAIENSNTLVRLKDQRSYLRGQKERKASIMRANESSLRGLQSAYNSVQRQISDEERCISESNQIIAYAKARMEKYQDEIDEIRNRGKSADVERAEEKVRETLRKITGLTEKKSQYEAEYSRLSMWKERIMQFYVHLTNTALGYIQARCNSYLDKIGSDLTIRIEGFRTLASGKIRDSINVVIERGGVEQDDWRCFSGGERGRLIFSTILALQEMVNQESEAGLDLLIIDEVLDQVDAEGMKMFIRSLQGLSKTIFLVSQVRTESNEGNIILVIKENDKSRIEI